MLHIDQSFVGVVHQHGKALAMFACRRVEIDAWIRVICFLVNFDSTGGGGRRGQKEK